MEDLSVPKLAFENIHHVLRRKGYLILDVPSKSNLVDMLLSSIGREPTWGSKIDRTHVAFYDEESMKSLLHSNGFETIKVRGVSFIRYDLLSLFSFTWNKRKWWLPKLIDAAMERFFNLGNLGAIQVFLCETSSRPKSSNLQ
ncbi:MAG: hypothetical protein JSV05_03760 [Candidatus Bathyarchaeota archaeon]|nr:MAG: hypothetical protein JSV05_03760 [Candidatus Bathyarchaeota archaeon]